MPHHITNRSESDERIKTKIVFDAAKGLASLHENDALHWDIKPDNVPVISLDKIISVNGKLTDFGSSRNVNMLMTNMTFTKGIGPPTYTGQEIVNKDKYKKAADVFSFTTTINNDCLFVNRPVQNHDNRQLNDC